MSFINDKTQEINCKIIYYGPPKSGKSATLRHIYKEASRSTAKEAISLAEGAGHALHFDFVPLNLGKIKNYTIRLHLYTLPQTALYKQSRAIISKGIDGIVFIADSRVSRMEANVKSLADLKTFLRSEGYSWEDIPHIYQFNKRDLPDALPAKELRHFLNDNGTEDFETVATTGKGISEAFQTIGTLVLRNLKKTAV